MLHGLLITCNADTTELLGRVIRTSGQITLDRFFSPPPNPYQLTTALQTLPIDVVYLDAGSDIAQLIADQVRRDYPGIALIGFSTTSLEAVPKTLTDFSLELPLSVDGLLATTRKAICATLRGPFSRVVAILPSKAGCGASTIAMNLAAHSARLDRRVILIDGDLRSGAIGDCLGISSLVPLAETLSLADVAAQLIWPRHVSQKEGVDCLLTDRNPRLPRPAWHSYYHLLRFLDDRYDQVLVDLPELTNDATSFILQYASNVYLVAAPEPLSLKLAQQRLGELGDAGVASERIGVLINRWERGFLTANDITQALGHPVRGVFPNDYRLVTAAVHKNTFVPAKTRLGDAYRAFTTNLISDQQKSECFPQARPVEPALLAQKSRLAALRTYFNWER